MTVSRPGHQPNCTMCHGLIPLISDWDIEGNRVCRLCFARGGPPPVMPPQTDFEPKTDLVNHPPHYGGADDPYEAIKVIEAWGLGFNLGNVLKYIRRSGAKGAPLSDLSKAQFYLNREIGRRKS